MITAIIQARLGSSRLPGKVLRDLCGKPVLQHVVERVWRCPSVSQIIVATTDRTEDSPIRAWCMEQRLTYVAWNKVLPDGKNDVLARFIKAADLSVNDALMRVTADCPLWSPQLGEEVIQAFFSGNAKFDLASNVEPDIDGSDTEVFWRESLIVTDRLATDLYDRQHVTPWMYRNLSVLHVGQLDKLPHQKLSIDTEKDFERVKNVLDKAIYHG